MVRHRMGSEARWRSGDAEDCKSLYAGSIPARASTSFPMRDCGTAAVPIGAGESAALAQLVEHIIRNDGVTCSSHVSGTRAFFEFFRPVRRLNLRNAPRAAFTLLGQDAHSMVQTACSPVIAVPSRPTAVTPRVASICAKIGTRVAPVSRLTPQHKAYLNLREFC